MKSPAPIPAPWLRDFGVAVLILQQHVIYQLPERLAAAMTAINAEVGSSDLPALIRASLDRALEQIGGWPHPSSWPPEKVSAWYLVIRPLGDPPPRSPDEFRERLDALSRETGTPWRSGT